jgi:hypothetical protein
MMADHRPTTEMPEPDAVVVVYDEQTGAVQYIHQEFTMPGGQSPSQADILKRAVELAGDMAEPGRNRPGQALALAAEDRIALREAKGPLKVDVSKRRLVPAAEKTR